MNTIPIYYYIVVTGGPAKHNPFADCYSEGWNSVSMKGNFNLVSQQSSHFLIDCVMDEHQSYRYPCIVNSGGGSKRNPLSDVNTRNRQRLTSKASTNG